MAAFSNQLSLFCSALLNVSSNALRQGPEIVFFLWMSMVLAFSLLLAAGFVV